MCFIIEFNPMQILKFLTFWPQIVEEHGKILQGEENTFESFPCKEKTHNLKYN